MPVSWICYLLIASNSILGKLSGQSASHKYYSVNLPSGLTKLDDCIDRLRAILNDLASPGTDPGVEKKRSWSTPN